MGEVDAALERVYTDRQSATRADSGVRRPHWRKKNDPAPGPQPEKHSTARLDTSVALEWPSVVLELERAIGDRFEQLAETVDQARATSGARVLLFTSCHRAEGRTTLVLALARALARRPIRTLIVDADLTGPMIARLLGIRPVVGIEDVVESSASLSDAIVHAADDNLAVLPLRSAIARPREFLSSAGWSCTLARLRREYDLVVLDGGPLFMGFSVAPVHRAVDAAILVRRPGSCGERSLDRACDTLAASGIRLLGLADTFI